MSKKPFVSILKKIGGLFHKKVKKVSLKQKKVLVAVGLIPLTLIISFCFYVLFFSQKIYPGVFIAGIDVSGKTKEEAVGLLKEKIVAPEKITLTKDGQVYEIYLKEVGFNYDFYATADKAYYLDRSGDVIKNIYQKVLTIKRRVDLPLIYSIKEDDFNKTIDQISDEVAVKPVYPSAKVVSGKVVIEKGKKGEELNKEKLLLDIQDSLSQAKSASISITTNFVDVTISDVQALIFEERVNKLLAKTLSISFEDSEFNYAKESLFDLLEPKGGYDKEEVSKVVENVSSKINRSPQNPIFTFVSGDGNSGRVQEFAPAKDGVEVNKEKLTEQILTSLEELEREDKNEVVITPQVSSTPSEYQTGEVNNLGIKELIGRGKSRFIGSIASRIHNISLASSKFNGILVKPGETFSFNSTLGDVSAETGYQQAYIIKEGATILGDGGGVCQVSTTIFRAVLAAGLPVIERRAHAYRVSYYEQDSPPGFDATVYDPSPDFKFKNDTPAHILIQTKVDTKAKTLVFEIYGTSDGRVSSTTKPTVRDVTPPPEDLYIDDPTLPAGQVKQIDWKAWGAKVSFKYTVVRNNETIYEKTFNSNFQPWQAKYLRGTGPAQ
jgi:vancomycin resistance protein YoaR